MALPCSLTRPARLSLSLFRQVKNDPRDVVIDFMDSRVMDHSALESINTLAERYGGTLAQETFTHLSDAGRLGYTDWPVFARPTCNL